MRWVDGLQRQVFVEGLAHGLLSRLDLVLHCDVLGQVSGFWDLVALEQSAIQPLLALVAFGTRDALKLG